MTIHVTDVDYSQVEIDAFAAEAGRLLSSRAGDKGAAIQVDVAGFPSVKIEVYYHALTNATRSQLRAAVPDELLVLKQADNPGRLLHVYPPYEGGYQVNVLPGGACTTGFLSGSPRGTSAGHCGLTNSRAQVGSLVADVDSIWSSGNGWSASNPLAHDTLRFGVPTSAGSSDTLILGSGGVGSHGTVAGSMSESAVRVAGVDLCMAGKNGVETCGETKAYGVYSAVDPWVTGYDPGDPTTWVLRWIELFCLDSVMTPRLPERGDSGAPLYQHVGNGWINGAGLLSLLSTNALFCFSYVGRSMGYAGGGFY